MGQGSKGVIHLSALVKPNGSLQMVLCSFRSDELISLLKEGKKKKAHKKCIVFFVYSSKNVHLCISSLNYNACYNVIGTISSE